MTNHKVDSEHPLPLYYQVYRSLLERIEAGEFAADNTLPPERQLADDYSVSRITIIKALAELEREGRVDRRQGRGTFVIPPRQLEVESGGKPVMITFFCRLVSHPVLMDIVAGIARMTEHHAQHLQILNSYDSQGHQADLTFIEAALSIGSQGLIMYPSVGDAHCAIAQALQERGVPIVMVDRYCAGVLTDRVVFNDEEAAHALTSHLIAQGHRRIVVIMPQFEMTVTTIYDRLKGYRRALEEHGIPFDDESVWMDLNFAFYQAEDPLAARQVVARRLGDRIEQEQPTAILCLNNDIADSLYQSLSYGIGFVAQVLNASEGPGFEVATFSSAPPALHIPCAVATAIHSGSELGTAAAQLLLGRLNGSITGPARTVTIPMQIVFTEATTDEIKIT
jgi:GntR family transcriptional regulator of arabinose operon